jgi:hypothetical protein
MLSASEALDFESAASYKSILDSIDHINTPQLMENNDKKQKFIKNDRYFTISIYVFLTTVACAVAIRAIFDFKATRAFFAGIFRAIGPFLIALLIAYLLAPFVRAVNRLMRRCFKKLPEKPAMVVERFTFQVQVIITDMVLWQLQAHYLKTTPAVQMVERFTEGSLL